VLSVPSGFGGLVPGGILLSKDLQRSLPLAEGRKVIFDVVVPNQFLFELGHRERTVPLETGDELAVVAVEEIHSRLEEVRLTEWCFDHGNIISDFRKKVPPKISKKIHHIIRFQSFVIENLFGILSFG
jgi:hypothetical protein